MFYTLRVWRPATTPTDWDFRQCGGDPKAERNIRRIRNRVKGEGRASRAIIAGGWTLAGLSIAGLIASCVFYFLRFEKVVPIDADLLKVLVPTFLFFLAAGVSLPFIRAIKGPAGIGFEKEITIRPESAPAVAGLERQ